MLGITLTELAGQDVGLIPSLFCCLRSCLMFLLHSFNAKQPCLTLWLSKPALLSDHEFIRDLQHFFFTYNPDGINCYITYFLLYSAPITKREKLFLLISDVAWASGFY